MTLGDRKYFVAKEPGFKKQVGRRAKAAMPAAPLEDSIHSVLASMRKRAEELLHFNKHDDAREIYGQMGDTYSDNRFFRLAGTYYKKAERFMDAGNAFMRCGEYFSAGRCFDSAALLQQGRERSRVRKMAQNAYERTGTKAQRENDLGLAHHAFRKAGRNGKADEIEKKAQRLKEINQRRIEKNAEFRRMHPTQRRSMNDFEAYSIDTASKTRLHNPVIFK